LAEIWSVFELQSRSARAIAGSLAFSAQLVIGNHDLLNDSEEKEQGHSEHAKGADCNEQEEDCEEMEAVKDLNYIWRGRWVYEHWRPPKLQANRKPRRNAGAWGFLNCL
jgi:hypothetical protein